MVASIRCTRRHVPEVGCMYDRRCYCGKDCRIGEVAVVAVQGQMCFLVRESIVSRQ